MVVGNFLQDLASQTVLGFFLLLAMAQIIAKELGFAVGRRQARNAGAKDESIGIVSTSIFGLLAFSLAFNLSISTARYSERLSAVLNEANAIGTLWLQAKAVNDPRAQAIAVLAEEYIKVRKAGVEAGWGSEDIASLALQADEIQTQMWGHMMALVGSRVDPQVTQLMGSMNGVFDATTATRFAVARVTPPEVIWLLLGMTVVAMAVLGYQFGLNGNAHRALGGTMILLWTTVLLVILDLGSARIGSIRIDTTAFESNMGSMKPILIPPLP